MYCGVTSHDPSKTVNDWFLGVTNSSSITALEVMQSPKSHFERAMNKSEELTL